MKKKVTLKEIEQFLAAKKLAVAGVSRDKGKMGYLVFSTLRQRGYEVLPINPNTDSIDTVKCYHSVDELPGGITHMVLVTPAAATHGIVDSALKKGIKNFWIQPGAGWVTVNEPGVTLIEGECIMMFSNPVKGIHNIHRFIHRLFGNFPR